MRSLIVYCSSHGTTRKAAHIIRMYLKGDVELINVENVSNLKFTDGFDTIIIGGSIHMGQIQKKIKMFMEENYHTLFTKQLGLFLCCWKDDFTALEQFNTNFPKELRNHAKHTAIFGGELIFSKMSIFEKFIVRSVAGVRENTYKLDEQAIMEFAHSMKDDRRLVQI